MRCDPTPIKRLGKVYSIVIHNNNMQDKQRPLLDLSAGKNGGNFISLIIPIHYSENLSWNLSKFLVSLIQIFLNWLIEISINRLDPLTLPRPRWKPKWWGAAALRAVPSRSGTGSWGSGRWRRRRKSGPGPMVGMRASAKLVKAYWRGYFLNILIKCFFGNFLLML